MNTSKPCAKSAICLLVYAIQRELWLQGKTGDRDYAEAIACLMLQELQLDPLFGERCEEFLDDLKHGNHDVA